MLLGVTLDDECKSLLKDGVVVIPNFLPTSEFVALRKEHKRLIENHNFETKGQCLSQEQYSPNSVAIYADDPKPSALSAFLQNPRLLFLLQVGEGRRKCLINWSQYEATIGGVAKDNFSELEEQIHSDTYFSTHKVFLYLHDVGIENGPFTYCRRTMRVTWRRLVREYASSLEKKATRDTWRPEEWEQKYLDLTEEPIVGLANTLIIADTNGFHKRTRGRTERFTVQLMTRHNPFRFSPQVK